MVTREELQDLAKKGDPDALYKLGLSYQEEAFATKNSYMLSNVAHLFDQAAKKGHGEAMFRLAKLHCMNRGIFSDADPRIAIDLFEKLIQKEPDACGPKIALGEMYCTAGKMYVTSAGFMLSKEGYITPDGSKLERNLSKGRKLIEDVVQNVDLDNLDFFNIQMLCQIYAGGWLRDDGRSTVDDTILAIKLCNKTIELAIIENLGKEINEASKQQINYLKKHIKTELKKLKFAKDSTLTAKNEPFYDEIFLDKLKANGLDDIAKELKQELKEEQELQERQERIERKNLEYQARIEEEKQLELKRRIERIPELKKIRENNAKYNGCISTRIWTSNTNSSHTVGLRADGTVVATGNNEYGQCNVSGWRNIIAISADRDHTVGLRADGTVVAVGDRSAGRCNVGGWRGWRNIIAIASLCGHTVGLRTDGTVIVAGSNGDYGWFKGIGDLRDIVAIFTNYGTIFGLRVDGTVVSLGDPSFGIRDVDGWRDIIAISIGNFHTVGLRADGTVVATDGGGYSKCDVDGWRDIVAISANGCYIVGLRADGTVVGSYNVDGWRDIVAISGGDCHLVGLRADGTVVATGDNECGQCNVDGWRDIVAIFTGNFHTVGLRADGTVVATGYNGSGQCYVSDWCGIGPVYKNNFSQGVHITVSCTNCGTPVKPEANFCVKCGKNFNSQ